ncbi:MAG: trans-sulfuration enzyme family protein [Ruminococcus sp.]
MNYTKFSYLAMISSDKKERKHFSERDHTNLEENHGKRDQYKCLHLEEEEGCCNNYGSISFPIYQTATYEHPAVGQSTGFDYSRLQNPTREHLEKIVATLENGIDALAFSTGMAAITLVMELFKPGDHLIIDADLYGGSIRLFDNVSSKNGIHFSRIDCWKENVESYVNENTKAIYIETPTNPMMNVTDIAALAEIAKRHNLLLIVDNTFLSPYFQNPLELGADIVVHSGTKFLGGHNDTLAGFLVTNREDISEKLRFLIKTTGSGLAPFDSWLILRGIKTLGIRMEQAQKNAFKIAEWLKTKSAVTRVIYPGLPDHPGYEIMKKQARGFGSMLTFQLESKEFALSVLEKVRMIKFAESLGGVETLITYPTTQTHADVPKEIRERNGITEATLRLSVGIEDAQDLLDEFEKVFAETEEELYGGKKS